MDGVGTPDWSLALCTEHLHCAVDQYSQHVVSPTSPVYTHLVLFYLTFSKIVQICLPFFKGLYEL